jgi:hypothetical protein
LKIADGSFFFEGSWECADGKYTVVRERAKSVRVLSLLHRCVVFRVKLTMPLFAVYLFEGKNFPRRVFSLKTGSLLRCSAWWHRRLSWGRSHAQGVFATQPDEMLATRSV